MNHETILYSLKEGDLHEGIAYEILAVYNLLLNLSSNEKLEQEYKRYCIKLAVNLRHSLGIEEEE